LFLSRVRPNCKNCYIRMDNGGETTNNSIIKTAMAKHNYTIETTGTDSFFQICIVERGQKSIGFGLR